MTLIPLTIPPGVYANGTDFQASNRWLSSSLVRWTEGTMRPVGGWDERIDLSMNAPRGILAWQDLSGDRRIAAGDYQSLKVASSSGTVTDISPSDLASGDIDATVNTGFGGGFFGVGFFGSPRPDAGNYGEATTWSLDNWGEYLVACSTEDGRLLEWQLDMASNAATISGAPIDNLGLLVSEERFLFALGAGGNPRKVQWCDREDNTTWTAEATNEAGDIELQTSGQIMQGIRTRGQSLILTDQDAHSCTYVGGQFVHSFQRVGSSCGAISRKAAAAVDAGVFWMGRGGFFVYQGGAVSDIPCDVSDYVFGDQSAAQITKAWAVSNSKHDEIWWFYASGSSNEVDRYVSYNYKEGHWQVGNISRTSGVDRGVFRAPIWSSVDGKAYNHETGLNYEGASVFAESGPISLGAGDQVMRVTDLIPDENTQGQVNATFKTRFHPNDTERSYGPYAMSNPTSVRFTGRQIRMRVEGNGLSDWRVGVMRLDAKGGGRR